MPPARHIALREVAVKLTFAQGAEVTPVALDRSRVPQFLGEEPEFILDSLGQPFDAPQHLVADSDVVLGFRLFQDMVT